MRYAIVSDIHANEPAWRAVHDDLTAAAADVVVCLGDIVGYGPRPREVLAAVREVASLFILGNHDAAMVGRVDLDRFRPAARRSALWTRRTLAGDAVFFGDLPLAVEVGDVVFVHAETPLPDDYGYVDDVDDAAACFETTDARVIFLGHTHVPGTFVQGSDGTIEEDLSARVELQPDFRYLINVGSVGDPRDGTQLASYALYDDAAHWVELRQVAFDVARFRAQILRVRALEVPYFLTLAHPAKRPAHHPVVHDEAIIAAKVSTVRVDRLVRKMPIRLGVEDLGRLGTRTPSVFADASGPPASAMPHRRKWLPKTVAGRAAAALVGAGMVLLPALRWMAGRGSPPPAEGSIAAPMSKAPETSSAPTPSPAGSAGPERDVITLMAERADRYGKDFRLETMFGQRHIGYWSNPSDYVVWRFRIARGGEYDVELEYALAPIGDGNRVNIACGRHELVCPLPSTGGWSNFTSRAVGRLPLPEGLAVLDVRPADRPRAGTMNLRAVRLRPSAAGNARGEQEATP